MSFLDYNLERNGYVRVESVDTKDFELYIQDKTEKELKSWLQMSLTCQVVAPYGKLGRDHVKAILLLVAKRKETVKEAKPKALVVQQEPESRVAVISKEKDVVVSRRVYTGGYQDPTDVARLARTVAMSVSFKKETEDHKVVVEPLPTLSTGAKTIMTDLHDLGEATKIVAKSQRNPEELEVAVTNLLVSEEKAKKDVVDRFNKCIPLGLKGKVSSVSDRLANKPINSGELKARSTESILRTVATTEKYGPGYYNSCHYDGVPIRGSRRKIFEMVCDFDYGEEFDVIRLCSSDPARAHALRNAVKHKVKRDVLVLYAAKSSGPITDYWRDGKVIKYGVVPCDNMIFNMHFNGHESKVYYYITQPPVGAFIDKALARASANVRMQEVVEALSKYGYYSFYANTASLVLRNDIELARRLDPRYESRKFMTRGFSPSCKVRKGIYRVTPGGEMTASDVYNNVNSGRVHYLTWLYRDMPFSYTDSPGHEFYQPTEHLLNENHPDDAHQGLLDLLDSIIDVVPREKLDSYRVQDEEEERPEGGSNTSATFTIPPEVLAAAMEPTLDTSSMF
jgi:hypothetical protein